MKLKTRHRLEEWRDLFFSSASYCAMTAIIAMMIYTLRTGYFLDPRFLYGTNGQTYYAALLLSPGFYVLSAFCVELWLFCDLVTSFPLSFFHPLFSILGIFLTFKCPIWNSSAVWVVGLPFYYAGIALLSLGNMLWIPLLF